MVTGPVIAGKAETGEMVCTPGPGMSKPTVAAPAAALASSIAWRKEPAPELSVLVTVNCAAWAGLADSKTPAAIIATSSNPRAETLPAAGFPILARNALISITFSAPSVGGAGVAPLPAPLRGSTLTATVRHYQGARPAGMGKGHPPVWAFVPVSPGGRRDRGERRQREGHNGWRFLAVPKITVGGEPLLRRAHADGGRPTAAGFLCSIAPAARSYGNPSGSDPHPEAKLRMALRFWCEADPALFRGTASEAGNTGNVYSSRMSKDRASSMVDFGVRVGAVVEHDGALLLVRHRKPDREPYWVLPGGRLEPGETIPECAEREVLEETGLSGRFAGVLYVSEFLREGRHTVDVTARVEVAPGEAGEATLGGDPEVAEGSEPTLREVRWVGLEELRGMELLPQPLKARVLADAAAGWPAGEVYLGGAEDA